MSHVIALAKDDEYVKNELKISCNYLTICLENIIKCFDPEEIIIDCEYLSSLPEYFDYLSNLLRKSQWIHSDRFNLKLNTIENIYATGAAMRVFDNIYSTNSENLLLDKFNDA